jgi:dihydrofolate reductase
LRKLKIQVQSSLDGYMAATDNDMSWMIWDWDSELNDYVTKLTNIVSTILLGRNLGEGFIDHWMKISNDKNNPENEAGLKMYETEKYVFSKSLKSSRWEHTHVVNSDLKQYVEKLNSDIGGDIIAYGGVQFINSLIETELVDEYNIFMNPTALANGKSIFTLKKILRLVKSKQFACGIVGLQFN